VSEQLVALLYEAAYRIGADAQALADAHTRCEGDWTGEPLAQAEYLDDMRLVTRLIQAAEELEAGRAV
jgi:hypothetical protein